MALSRYSVLPDQQIVNTHVNQDLSLVNKVLATKQGAYDEAAAFDQQQEGIFGKHQVRNADIARRDALHNDYVTKAQALVDGQYNGDYSQAMPALKRLANGYAGNEFWNRATSALDREKEDYKLREQLRKEGKNVLDFAPGMTQKAIYNDADGSYSDISYNTQGQTDWVKARKEALGKIEENGGSGALRGSGAAGILRHVDSEWVGASDVQRVALDNFRGYLNGSDGTQEYNSLRASGYSKQDAQARVLQNLVGAGSNQIHSKSKAGYHNDPLAQSKYDALKDQDQVIIGQGSQASDYNPMAGLDISNFERKDRYEGAASLGGAASAFDGGGSSSAGKKLESKYGKLDAKQRDMAATLLRGVNPGLAAKLSSGKITDAEMDQISPLVQKRMKALANIKFAPQVTTIPESMNYGSYGKGEVGATKMVEAKMSGMVWINKATGEKLSGKDFVEKNYNPARAAASKSGAGADGVMRVMGQVSPFNHFGMQYNDNRFGDAMQVAIDGNEWVGGGLDQKKQHLVSDKYGRKAAYMEDISGPRNRINEIATKTVSMLGSPVQILPGKNAPKFTLKLNDDGTYTFPEQQGADGNPLTVDNPSEYIQQALDHYEDVQHQQASNAATKRR